MILFESFGNFYLLIFIRILINFGGFLVLLLLHFVMSLHHSVDFYCSLVLMNTKYLHFSFPKREIKNFLNGIIFSFPVDFFLRSEKKKKNIILAIQILFLLSFETTIGVRTKLKKSIFLLKRLAGSVEVFENYYWTCSNVEYITSLRKLFKKKDYFS